MQLSEPGPRCPPNRESIGIRFARFDAAHPEVYTELRRLALDKVLTNDAKRAARRDGVRLVGPQVD